MLEIPNDSYLIPPSAYNDYRMSKRRKAFRQTDFFGLSEFK